MIKRSKSSIIILITGFIALIIVTVCAIKKEEIIHSYYEYKIDKKYSSSYINDYYIEDSFSYVNNYDDITIKNNNELIDFMYFALNSGNEYMERHIDSSYKEYFKEIASLTQNDGYEIKQKISILNNFVHPYNSSNNIKLSYGGEYTIGITINKAYSEDEIHQINEIVDNVIQDKITNNMPSKEKIKIIHDYIIDNTQYDKLKYDNKEDNTYKSNTAYGVLIEGYGTCNGYADAMAIFLNKINIINYKISNDEHIWNLVYLDGNWYHLDLTWDDPISEINVNRDTYFLISTDTLEKINDDTHSFDKKIYSEAA